MVGVGMIHTDNGRFGNIIYDGSTISQILFDGGYITFDEETDEPLYHFYITDHQDNNRLVVDANGSVEERNDYYPYGSIKIRKFNICCAYCIFLPK